jgi:diadenylate cyclase
MDSVYEFALEYWRAGVEIAILSVVIYYAYIYFRGTRGAKVLTGLALIFLTLFLVSQILDLKVIRWLMGSLTAFLAVALVVIFQPELRRGLAALGSHRFFSWTSHNKETVAVISEAVFELSNRQFGALIALERDINTRAFSESGVSVDCELTTEMVLTIFQPKTPLHDGGLIIRNDRILAAACIFPVSQREDLNRNLGLRHRAALGISEETDALAIVVSEETGIVSICHRGRIERDFDPESFKRRIGELLILQNDERSDSQESGGKDRVAAARDHALVSHQQEHRNDDVAI